MSVPNTPSVLLSALRQLNDAVRIIDVMLNEPAAEGLMTAEDYRSYLGGAWLGVHEAQEAAAVALVEECERADALQQAVDDALTVFVDTHWWLAYYKLGSAYSDNNSRVNVAGVDS